MSKILNVNLSPHGPIDMWHIGHITAILAPCEKMKAIMSQGPTISGEMARAEKD